MLPNLSSLRLVSRRSKPVEMKRRERDESAQTLPGTEITFEQGLRLFTQGVLFYMDTSKNVQVAMFEVDGNPKSVLNKLMVKDGPVRDNWGKLKVTRNIGSSNSFYSLDSELCREIAATTNNGASVVPDMGARISRDVLSRGQPSSNFNKKALSLWEELWATLHAASMGLHPHVFLAGLWQENTAVAATDPIKYRSVYVTARYVSLQSGLRSGRDGWGADNAGALDVLVRDISRAGFIHTDIKPANVLVDESLSSGRKFMIIDMGSDFLRFVQNDEIAVECIQLINTLLMIITVFCHGDAQQNAIKLTGALRVTLRQLHGELEARAPVAGEAPPQDEYLLCNYLRVLKLSEREQIGEDEDSFFANDDYNKLARAILSVAAFYAGLEGSGDGDEDMDCADTEDWRVIFNKHRGDLSAYQIFIKAVSERIRTGDVPELVR